MVSIMRFAFIPAVILGAGYMLLGPDTLSVVQTAHENLVSSIRDARSLDFEIDRVDHLLDGAVAEMSTARRQIAEMEVDLESYDRKIGDQRAGLERRRAEIARLSDELRRQAGSTQITVDGTTYDRSSVASRIDRLVEQHNRSKGNLAHMVTSHGERAQAVMSARGALQGRQEELVELRNQVDLKRLSLATESLLDSTDRVNPSFPALDDSRQLLERIEHDLTVSRRMRELKSGGALPLDFPGGEAVTVDGALARAEAALNDRPR